MEDTRMDSESCDQSNDLNITKVKRYCVHRKMNGPNAGQLCGKTALHNGTQYLLPHERLSPEYQAYFCMKHHRITKRTMGERRELFEKASKVVQKGLEAVEKRRNAKDVKRVPIPMMIVAGGNLSTKIATNVSKEAPDLSWMDEITDQEIDDVFTRCEALGNY